MLIDRNDAEKNRQQARCCCPCERLAHQRAADEYADGELEVSDACGTDAANRSDQAKIDYKSECGRDKRIDQQGGNGSRRGCGLEGRFNDKAQWDKYDSSGCQRSSRRNLRRNISKPTAVNDAGGGCHAGQNNRRLTEGGLAKAEQRTCPGDHDDTSQTN